MLRIRSQVVTCVKQSHQFSFGVNFSSLPVFTPTLIKHTCLQSKGKLEQVLSISTLLSDCNLILCSTPLFSVDSGCNFALCVSIRAMSDLSDHDVIQDEVSLQELLTPLIPTGTHIARINDMCWMLKSMAESLEQDHRRASDQLRVAACSLQSTIEYFEATRWHQLLQIRISLQNSVRRYGRFLALDIYGHCGG